MDLGTRDSIAGESPRNPDEDNRPRGRGNDVGEGVLLGRKEARVHDLVL